MSIEEEPSAGDILASRIGLNGLHGHVWALHYLLTSLLIAMREKGALKTGDLEVILEATEVTLSDKFDRLASETPKGAEVFDEMKTRAKSMLELIQRDLKNS